MSTIGILGGGQLARMLAIAGVPLGQRFLVVDSAADACAGEVAPLLRADWRDFEALAEFARRVDVATFDFENVPAETAQWLTEHTQVFPNPRALALAQDRLAEKNLFREIGLAAPAFAPVDSREDLAHAIAAIGLPAVLKTRRLGYDGKGQAVLRSAADADAAWAALGSAPLILESFIAFRREVSVVAVRSRTGEFRHYPLTQNWHAGGILAASLAPAPDSTDLDSADLERRAVAHARALAERLDYVGTFALELFDRDGDLLGNEIAPRVHNSGHWTIEGAVCSQFENHLRAVLGLATRRYICAGHQRDAQLDRRVARCECDHARIGCALARLRQAAARGPQGRSRRPVCAWLARGIERAPRAHRGARSAVRRRSIPVRCSLVTCRVPEARRGGRCSGG